MKLGAWGVMFVATLLSAGASAQAINPENSKKPIEITANSLEVLQEQRKATFSGAVKAVQGDVTLASDAMTVFYGKSGAESSGGFGAIERIEATGNVLLTTPGETASGEKGIYKVAEKKVYLMQNVILTKDKNVLKGSALEYSFATGRSLMTSGAALEGQPASGGRVKAVFVPSDKKGK